MKWFKRISLFLLVNVAVMITISVFLNVVLPLFGIRLNPASIGGLMVWCLVWGMGGAFISLFMSKWLVKRSMGVQVIDPNTAQPQEREILNMVYRMAQNAGLEKMPEVGIYEAADINAFATGPSRKNSLVAVSSGLLNQMNKNEIEGVIAHEVAHVANGDMVTMTLITGIVNAFTMFLARIVARGIASSVDERSSQMVYFVTTLVLDIVFTIAGSIVISYFSRRREFRADYGGAVYAGRDKMIAGLRRLQSVYDRMPTSADDGLAAMKISSKPGGIMALFSTHPPLEARIARLQEAVIVR